MITVLKHGNKSDVGDEGERRIMDDFLSFS